MWRIALALYNNTVSASLSGRSCRKYRKATRFEIFSDVINGPNSTRLWN